MDTLVTSLLSSLAAQGPLFVALAVAIFYLKQSDDKKAAANAALIEAMNQERTGRIGILEEHVVDCNKRHDAATAKYEALLMRVARLDHNDKPHAPQ